MVLLDVIEIHSNKAEVVMQGGNCPEFGADDSSRKTGCKQLIALRWLQDNPKGRTGMNATEGPAAVRLDASGGRFCVTGDVLAALERAAGDSLPMGKDDNKAGHPGLSAPSASSAAGVHLGRAPCFRQRRRLMVWPRCRFTCQVGSCCTGSVAGRWYARVLDGSSKHL